jgi:hypothetical protein
MGQSMVLWEPPQEYMRTGDIITKHGELDENMLRTIWNTIIQNWASWDLLFLALFVTIFLGLE